ncbi:hypothetical protein P7K49_020271 [Saguinus oedipus]|uniref:Uncharacterized protein n=1 Tax=Saguinus oedipus TaxID=9490 RepID=A0ABQ9UZR2_SAGOE|nr:hypothetical protein P7K49_020271 [Saguinus oedipus]
MLPWAAAAWETLQPPPSPPRAATVRAGSRAEAVTQTHAALRRYVKRYRQCKLSLAEEGGSDRGGEGAGTPEVTPLAAQEPETQLVGGRDMRVEPGLVPPTNPASLLRTGSEASSSAGQARGRALRSHAHHVPPRCRVSQPKEGRIEGAGRT